LRLAKVTSLFPSLRWLEIWTILPRPTVTPSGWRPDRVFRYLLLVPRVEVCRYEAEDLRALVPVASASELRREGVFATWVFGVEDSGASDDVSFDLGQPLSLVSEPENEWNDPNCLAVWNDGRTAKIGYIPPYLSAGLIDAGWRIGTSLYELLREGRRVSLGMLVSREPVTLVIVERSPERTKTLAAALPMDRNVAPTHPMQVDPVERLIASAEWLARKEKRRGS